MSAPLTPSPLELKAKLKRAMLKVFQRLPHLHLAKRVPTFVITEPSDRAIERERRRAARRQEEPQEPLEQVMSKVNEVYLPSRLLAEAPFEEVVFVVAHEMIHAYFLHQERGLNRAPALWQQASDYEANSILKRAGFSLIEQALYEPTFERMSAEAIYDALKSTRCLWQQDARPTPRDKSSLAAPKHQWDEQHQRDDALCEEVMRVALSDCYGASDPEQEGEPQRLGVALRDSSEGDAQGSAQAQGLLGGRSYGTHHLEQQLKALSCDEMGRKRPWGELLRHFSAHRTRRYSANRFRRRDIPKGLYLPSMRGDGLRLVVALDTSGSTKSLLPSFLQEVGEILKACPYFELTLIQCSHEISAVDHLSQRSLINLSALKLVGGGGTAFEPVFTYVRESEAKPPNLLIYLTDGCGPTVREAPDYPVFWVLSDGGTAPASFGLSLPLEPKREVS